MGASDCVSVIPQPHVSSCITSIRVEHSSLHDVAGVFLGLTVSYDSPKGSSILRCLTSHLAVTGLGEYPGMCWPPIPPFC
jgi:hypothetical protein